MVRPLSRVGRRRCVGKTTPDAAPEDGNTPRAHDSRHSDFLERATGFEAAASRWQRRTHNSVVKSHGVTRVASPVLCSARSMLRLVPINDPRRKRIGRAEQCLRSAQRCDISDARVKEHVHGPREQRARGAIAAACSIKQPPLPKHGCRTRDARAGARCGRCVRDRRRADRS